MDKIFNDGYYLEEVSEGRINNLAAFSLHNSLLNYATTAKDLDHFYSNKQLADSFDQIKKDGLHGKNYTVDACNAIVQFQHFLELFLKDVLLQVSDLMVYDPSQQPLLLYKMINGEHINNSELEKLKFIEFSEALNRVKALYKHGKLDPSYNFLAKYFELFKQVNTLRNRIAHRGAFIIRHTALDKIFGQYILPFIKELESNVDEYSASLSRWMNIKDDAFKPFDLIISEYQKTNPSEYAVYTFKLMAYAGYHNSLQYGLAGYFQSFLDKTIKEAESIAKIVAGDDMFDVKICPICGCKTFIEYTDSEDEEDDKGNIIGLWTYVSQMKCNQCGFLLRDWLGREIKDLRLIPDYFWIR